MIDVKINIEQLFEQLKNKMSNENYFKIDILETNKIIGNIKGEYFCILYTSFESLLLSFCDGKTKNFEFLKNVLTSILECSPICSYDLINEKKIGDIKPTYEWCFKKVENRLKRIENGIAFSNFSTFNINYIDNCYLCELKNNCKNVRLHGKYDGGTNFNFKDIKEIELFLIIKEVENGILFLERNKNIKEFLELEELKYFYESLIYNTRRFGVSIPKYKNFKKVEITEEYKNWYALNENKIKKDINNYESFNISINL